MDKAKLAPYVERLAKAEGKERNTIVAEMSKELGIKISDCWKALKEAKLTTQTEPVPEGGNNLQEGEANASTANVAQPGANPAPPALPDSGAHEGKTVVVLRHKTPHKLYRRAGVVLTHKASAYEVSAEQLSVLGKDRWVVFENAGKGDDAE